MEKVLSVAMMKAAESFTMNKFNISETDLMAKAGKALAEDFLTRGKPGKSNLVLFVLGIGNNGGDGLVVFRTLIEKGYLVKLLIIGNITNASESFKYYFDENFDYVNTKDKTNLEQTRVLIESADYIIDGIFGIGLKREIKGIYKEIVDMVNLSSSTTYSLDIPSGISPENGIILGTAIKSDLTGVVGYLKFGNLLNDALDYHGKIKVLDVGIISETESETEYIDFHDVDISPLERKHNSHKYTYGLGLFLGGNITMMGSIQMSAMAAMKSGLGIARVLHGKSVPNVVQLYPELILQSISKYETVKQFLPKAKTIVFGPGMEKNSPMFGRVLDHLLNKEIPLLVDANGLEYININQSLESEHVIITPHAGELARMVSVKVEEVLENPLRYINSLTKKGYVVLLKGPATIIADKEKTYILQAKNPGLAKAGTGDVLSGIISAYLVDDKPIRAAVKGMALHSLVAEKARESVGVYSLTATDIINSISKVLKAI